MLGFLLRLLTGKEDSCSIHPSVSPPDLITNQLQVLMRILSLVALDSIQEVSVLVWA